MRYSKTGMYALEAKPEWQMLLHLSWPIILSLLAQGFYGFIDSIYLAKLGDRALSAASLSFVVQGFMSALFTGIATGINALISRALGGEKHLRARETMLTGLLVQGFFVCTFMACGIWCARFYFQTSTQDEHIIRLGVAYLRPTLLFALPMAMQITLERVLQATGLSRMVLYSQGIGSIVNILLDPIFIFGGFGIPAFGIAGAAYATAIGQTIATILALCLNMRYNQLLFSKIEERILPRWKTAMEICFIGIPSSAVGIAASLANYCINWILLQSSSVANAAFGVYTKLQSIAMMPSQGIQAGLVTQLSFFYGKLQEHRIRKSMHAGFAMIASWSTLCGLAFLLIPHILLTPFSPTQEMYEFGVPAFRIIGSTFLVSGYMLTFSAFYQAFDRSYYAFVTTATRQIFVRIPIAFLLEKLGDINLIWWCWPISELTSDLVNTVLFTTMYRSLPKLLEKQRQASN